VSSDRQHNDIKFMGIIGTEVHVVDRIFGALKHVFLFPINHYRYKKYLGDYTGGKGRITIKYRLIDWGKFSIDAVEPAGERWEGKYSFDDYSLIGKYRWNIEKNPGIADIGEHELYFSEDGQQIQGNWEELTGQGTKGAVYWKKINI
jgi:hypothetical protein